MPKSGCQFKKNLSWICSSFQIKDQRLRFRYNLGSGEEMVSLHHVNVSDGQWHTAYVNRIGKMAIMKLDGGEGRFYNVSLGSNGGHLQIKVAKRLFYAGGDVKFPSSQAPAIVDYDFRDSKSGLHSSLFHWIRV